MLLYVVVMNSPITIFFAGDEYIFVDNAERIKLQKHLNQGDVITFSQVHNFCECFRLFFFKYMQYS